MRRDSGPWETVATLPANTQSHELVLLDKGNYDIRVTAFNSEGLHSEICDKRANGMINIEQPIAFRIFDHGFE